MGHPPVKRIRCVSWPWRCPTPKRRIPVRNQGSKTSDANDNSAGGSVVDTALHAVDQRSPLDRLIPLGIQHVLAFYAGAIAPPLIVAGALKLHEDQIAFLINADLFAGGLVTLIHTLGLGRLVGTRLPPMMGVTFASVLPRNGRGNGYSYPRRWRLQGRAPQSVHRGDRGRMRHDSAGRAQILRPAPGAAQPAAAQRHPAGGGNGSICRASPD